MVKKTTQFRRLLASEQVEFLMEAHDGLSARIVEEAGFKGIWASGLCISASLGVRDNNEASWTQVLDVVEYMSDASSVPILLDADTGYGNFNNVRRLVNKLEQRQVAAMCIEDKLFPKTNSFIGGEQQPLADVDEFCGKIHAAKDTQQDPDFSVVARVEAFIAGWGLDEALRRAEAYHRAGADAVLIHSKIATADEVLAFLREWAGRSPVVLVPTTYSATPASVFQEAGASLVIWANHLLRSTITAMQRTTAQIFLDQSVFPLESEIATVKEVFRLQNAAELKDAERRYLPKSAQSAKAILLAGNDVTSSNGNGHGNGSRNDTLSAGIGPSALQRQITDLNHAGIKRILVSSARAREQADLVGVRIVNGERAGKFFDVACLSQVADELDGPVLLALCNVLVEPHVVRRLLSEPGDIVLAVDPLSADRQHVVRFDHLTKCSASSSRAYAAERPTLREFTPEDPHGEWIGIAKLSPEGTRLAAECLNELRKHPRFREMGLSELFGHLVARGTRIDVMYVNGHWLNAGPEASYSETAHA